ncbi:hypothetical protein SAMN05216345_104272 [Cupriavidus sp. YR651]|uniref:hypothetical protein n=1 Tax=Cupriavidus sp. YR651 TaxID=1855315 RepID=UPI00087F74F0|nr:hypothetical protein [Cupriavidus sp. YR651]SDC87617.1 hypothetical protein SAMN05216345_104272 [Cupriavidus sp. YR651]
MKQHLAKSLLMAGALVASYPLLAQQAQPVQPAQPMPMTQPMQSVQPASSVQPMQAVPVAATPDQGAPTAARDPYAQGGALSAQSGAAPASAPASIDPTQARSPGAAMDAPGMSLAPDALGTRLGQRNAFLDGA